MARKIILLISAAVLLAAAVLIWRFESAYGGKFYPGVVIGGVPVDGKSKEEVLDYFKSRADAFAKNGLTIIFEGSRGMRTVKIPIAISGFSSDVSVEYFVMAPAEETVEAAFEWGRKGSFWRQVQEKFALISGRDFLFRTKPNALAINSLLDRELGGFFRPALEAEFAVSSAGVYINQEKTGESVERAGVILAIAQRLRNLDSSPLNFEASPEIPEVTAEKLKPFLPLAKELAQKTKLIFKYSDKHWKVSGAKLITWLTVKDREIGVDEKKLEKFLAQTVAPLVDDPPKNSRFEIKDGKLVEIVPGKSGNVVDVARTADKVLEIIPDIYRSFVKHNDLFLALASVKRPQVKIDVPTGLIDIPVEIIKIEPRITPKTVDEYAIKDLVGMARTNFAGSSADRKKNIATGIAKLSGILIAPGEEFSAVRGIGTTTVEEGFVPEFVIKEDKSIKELGGGLCQVATTLFRTVLAAGLPVTERFNHSYVVSYYGPGLDATIYDPYIDLKFVNDTDHYLLLQGRVEGNEAVFELYGRRDGRNSIVSDVQLTDPLPAPETKYVLSPDLPAGTIECSETPRGGVTAEATYTVLYRDGKTHEQKFKSIYKPWSKICLMGYKT
jgi:vancomycin resistance protein YoaR